MEACTYGKYTDTLNMPSASGARECYRLSSPICTPMRNRNLDSPAMTWFHMDTSIVTWIAYCISNNRGLSSLLLKEGFGRQDGEINFHRDKPEGDTPGWPQSCAPFGLASHSVRRGGHV